MKFYKILIFHICVISIIVNCEYSEPGDWEPQGGISFGYALTDSAFIQFEIENRFDKIVRHIDVGEQPPGSYSFTWDQLGENGQRLAKGYYFVFFLKDGERQPYTGRAILLEHTNNE
ncbi:MAG: hypothetical protein H8D23_06995 [Candidatus Brocadiales bacterium]|nr:hypothetical protein [Candidatus Brocadiales bacterium]